MDLNPRKLRILRAIVDEYILSGAPVGSKVLSQNPSFKLSSATIRNEMADLEDLGKKSAKIFGGFFQTYQKTGCGYWMTIFCVLTFSPSINRRT